MHAAAPPGLLADRAQAHLGRLSAVAPAVLVAALLAGTGATDGGYFPSAWGWTALALLWAAALGLVLRRPALRPVELVPAAALAVLALVSLTGPAGPREAQRTLVYVAAALAVPLLLGRRTAAAVAPGALAGVTAVSLYSLGTRLFPDRLGVFDPIAGYRLAEPLGYWNGLGIFAAIAVVLAVGVAAATRGIAGRALAAASLVPLALTIYFTFSRGAWIALAVGLLAALAFETRRVRFLTTLAVVAPAPAAAVWLASGREALTTITATTADAAVQGHEVALLAAVLTAAAAVAGLALAVLDRLVAPPPRLVRAVGVAIALGAAVALAAVFVRFGAPWTIAERAWSAFSEPPTTVTDLNQRLLSFSGTGRVTQWQAALDAWRSEPWTGVGAGGFEAYWLEHREVAGKVRDAHSLYLEQLAELGPLGLALILVALGIPLYAAVRARGRPLAAAIAGGYLAYLAHAGVDWDWELPAVTLAAILLGTALLVAARDEEAGPPRPVALYALLGAIGVLVAAAFVGLVGNMALAESDEAARAGDFEAAAAQAEKARRWAPWSYEPWQRLGRAQLAQGELAAARASLRKASEKAPRDWALWLDLARASDGPAQERALAEATRLNPLSPELAQLRSELEEFGQIAVVPEESRD